MKQVHTIVHEWPIHMTNCKTWLNEVWQVSAEARYQLKSKMDRLANTFWSTILNIEGERL